MKRKPLTYGLKIVWDEILNNRPPIDMYGFPISEEGMLEILKIAINKGLIITDTNHICRLSLLRGVLHVYIPEKVLVNLLYRLDVPVYYESLGFCAGKMRYRFYAKILSLDINRLNVFIDKSVDEYVDECYNDYKRRVLLYRKENRNEM